MQYLSEKISEAMKREGVTYTALSKQLGIARSTAWRKMHSPDKWTAGELERLANLLDIDFVIYR
jgi:transcriptional regulator with XRE-family HTH domain